MIKFCGYFMYVGYQLTPFSNIINTGIANYLYMPKYFMNIIVINVFGNMEQN